MHFMVLSSYACTTVRTVLLFCLNVYACVRYHVLKLLTQYLINRLCEFPPNLQFQCSWALRWTD